MANLAPDVSLCDRLRTSAGFEELLATSLVDLSDDVLSKILSNCTRQCLYNLSLTCGALSAAAGLP